MKYQEDIEKAKAQREEVTKFVNNVRKKKPKHLDEVVHAAHHKTFETIDCLSCANCCKTTSPIFRDVDVTRIAKKFKVSNAQFEATYLKRDDDGDLVLQESPCTFLNDDNTCFIYDIRPQACREYPHTDRKRMIQILDLTRKNTEVCPAVSRIVFQLMKEIG